VSRRTFLQTSALTAGAATLAGGPSARAQEAKKDDKVLPTRKLGKTGVDVTILTQGTWQAPGLDRLLRFSYANGVRYYDTAKSYGSEPGLRAWFKAMPEVRKSIFLVTKDSPREPRELITMLDQRLENLGTDYVDLFFIHALGDHSVEHGLEWPKSAELGKVIEKIKASGKAKYVGFSTHHARRPEILQAAAEGNFVDAVMLQFTPWLDTDAPLNKAIDACHAKGIGLISMKQVAGRGAYNAQTGAGDVLAETKKKIPMLEDRGLSLYQGLLQAIWSDERIATACVSMRNTDQIRENAEAARKFAQDGPLKKAEVHQLRDALIAMNNSTLCPDCDGRCAAAGGTKARLGDLTRYLTYHEHHGDRRAARQYYGELSAAERDWKDADLAAAREACPSKLDFARLLPEVDRHLA
jgi:predicted aldo/keto reductase-like oxidoreductase